MLHLLDFKFWNGKKKCFRPIRKCSLTWKNMNIWSAVSLKPEARMDIVLRLAEKNIVPTSMIDISDGLASELLHLGKNSVLEPKYLKENSY